MIIQETYVVFNVLRTIDFWDKLLAEVGEPKFDYNDLENCSKKTKLKI